MPIYILTCPKGHKFETYQSFEDYDKFTPSCPAHNLLGSRSVNMPKIGGTSSFKMHPHEVLQLGRSFSSAKEQERWMKKNNITDVHKDEVNKMARPYDVTKTKDYQMTREKLYQEINAAGGVEHPDGSISKISDKGHFTKVE